MSNLDILGKRCLVVSPQTGAGGLGGVAGRVLSALSPALLLPDHVPMIRLVLRRPTDQVNLNLYQSINQSLAG